MRQPLHESSPLTIYFAIDEETDEAFIELESTDGGPDLSLEDDIVVAIGGTVADLDRAEPNAARAALGKWADLEKEDLELMIRVGEWFESWELE